MVAIPSQIYFCFPVLWRLAFRKAKNYLHTKVYLLPLPISKRSPNWNSTSGFHIDLFTVFGMWFCISLPNFVQIQSSPMELWRHIDFSRWRLYRRKKLNFCFRVLLRLRFRKVQSYLHTKCKEISIPRNKRSPYGNFTFGFHIDLFTSVDMWFCISLPNFVQIRWSPTELWCHIDLTK